MQVGYLGVGILGRGNSECKGPEEGGCTMCWRHRKKARETLSGETKGESAGYDVRGVRSREERPGRAL